MVSDAILCPLNNLKNHLEYNHDTSQLCRTGHDDASHTRMTTLIFILSEFFPLMVKATMHSILNTVRKSFRRLYGTVEKVVTMCLVYKIWRLLCSYLPHPKKKKNPGFGFFVKIHLLESSKLDLNGLYFRSYSLMINFSYNC